jgi:hypothetical protein
MEMGSGQYRLRHIILMIRTKTVLPVVMMQASLEVSVEYPAVEHCQMVADEHR